MFEIWSFPRGKSEDQVLSVLNGRNRMREMDQSWETSQTLFPAGLARWQLCRDEVAYDLQMAELRMQEEKAL